MTKVSMKWVVTSAWLLVYKMCRSVAVEGAVLNALGYSNDLIRCVDKGDYNDLYKATQVEVDNLREVLRKEGVNKEDRIIMSLDFVRCAIGIAACDPAIAQATSCVKILKHPGIKFALEEPGSAPKFLETALVAGLVDDEESSKRKLEGASLFSFAHLLGALGEAIKATPKDWDGLLAIARENGSPALLDFAIKCYKETFAPGPTALNDLVQEYTDKSLEGFFTTLVVVQGTAETSSQLDKLVSLFSDERADMMFLYLNAMAPRQEDFITKARAAAAKLGNEAFLRLVERAAGGF
jgi:hypothetical protein